MNDKMKPIPKEFLSDPDTVLDLLNARAYNTRTGEYYTGIRLNREDVERLAAKLAREKDAPE